MVEQCHVTKSLELSSAVSEHVRLSQAGCYCTGRKMRGDGKNHAKPNFWPVFLGASHLSGIEGKSTKHPLVNSATRDEIFCFVDLEAFS